MSFFPADNTFCLTKDGWVDFLNLEKDEEILTFNDKKLELEFAKINKYNYYKSKQSSLYHFNNFILESDKLKLIVDERFGELKKVSPEDITDSKIIFSKLYVNNLDIDRPNNLLSKIISMSRKERDAFNIACYENGYRKLGRDGFKYSVFSKKNKRFAMAIQLSHYLDGKVTFMHKKNKTNKVISVSDKYMFSSFRKITKANIKDMWSLQTKNKGIVIRQNGFITIVG